MTDLKIRDLERQFRASGSAHDEAAWLRAREGPHAIGWLGNCRHDLPDGPGMVYLGIASEIQLIKLAEESIRSMINGFLDDPSYWKRFDNVSKHITAWLNRDLGHLWIAWTNYVWTDED